MSPYREPGREPLRAMRLCLPRGPTTVGVAVVAAMLFVAALVSVHSWAGSAEGLLGGLSLLLLVLLCARTAIGHWRGRTVLQILGNEVQLVSSGADAPEAFTCKLDEALDVVVESKKYSGQDGSVRFNRVLLVSSRGRHPLELGSPESLAECRVRAAEIKTFLALPESADAWSDAVEEPHLATTSSELQARSLRQPA